MNHTKILITGGNGLLGYGFQLEKHLWPDREMIFASAEDCNLTDENATLDFVEMIKPDAIIHLAAVSGGIQLSMNRPATLFRDNLLMLINILEAARKSGVKKVITTLSAGMYPVDTPFPIRENSIHTGPPHDSNYSYAFAKRMMEPAIRAYRHEYGLNIIGLVSNGIFGENANFSEETSVMLTAIIKRCYLARKNSDPVIIWGDGTPMREYTYSRDLARIFIWCLDNYDSTEILNIGSTEENSVRTIAELLAEYMGIPAVRLLFDTTKPSGIMRRPTDNTRFLKMSGFNYTPFAIALRQTVDWFLENADKPGRVRY